MFECKTCGKMFNSRHSLGGHASSHNRGESFKVGRKKDRIKKKHICKYCENEFETGWKLGGHQSHCKLNPNKEDTRKKISTSNKGKRHTEESKKKLSLSRIKYLSENPEKHPWKRHTKFKSEPCEKFKEILRDIGLIFEEEFNPIPDRFFAVDVAFPDQKLCFEINGEQHYNRDGSLRKYYRDRHDIIENSGWTIIEIHYSKAYDVEYVKELTKMVL
jgi:C2H2-type zinc finger